MALEHALLVSLSEQPASGLDLTRRFDASIGYFWQASHQQIYRVLGRMDHAGWVTATVVAQQGRPDKKEYDVTAAGRDELERWLAEPTPADPVRSELMVKLRGASYGDRSRVMDLAEQHRAEHRTRLAVYEQIGARDFPEPDGLAGRDLDLYLVLQAGVRLERFWVDWLGDYLAAHGHTTTKEPADD